MKKETLEWDKIYSDKELNKALFKLEREAKHNDIVSESYKEQLIARLPQNIEEITKLNTQTVKEVKEEPVSVYDNIEKTEKESFFSLAWKKLTNKS